MAKIYFHTPSDWGDEYPMFESDVIPRKGELITIENVEADFYHTPYVKNIGYDYKHENGVIILESVTVYLGGLNDI